MHFSIGSDRHIVEWNEAAARLLGVPGAEALGTPCNTVLGGKDDFGGAVCGPDCAASRALSAGSIAGTSHMLVRTGAGERLRLACDLIALPDGGALGRLRRVGDVATDLVYDLASIAALTARVSDEPLRQGLRDALGFLLHATLADAGEIFLAEPHGKGLTRACHQGRFRRAFDQLLHFDPGEGFPGLVLSQRQPVYTDHLPEDPRFLRTQVKREGFRTYVCTALISRSDVVGCIALAFRRSDIELERVLSLLRWVGAPLGLVIDTALARLLERATLLLDGVEDDPEHRLPRALHALLQEMARLSHADFGELYLPWHEPELRWLASGVRGVPRCPVLNADMIAQCPAFETGTASLLHGQRKVWPLACRATPHPGGAWCCIPIACGGASLGVIRLLHRRVRSSPPNENIVLLEALASLAAKKLRDIHDRFVRAPRVQTTPRQGLRREVEAPAVVGDAARRPIRSDLSATDRRRHDAHLEIHCFGALELSVDGARVAPAAIRRKRVLTLLGILLTHHDKPQCKDALIEMLWPDADPEVRTGQLHVLVHELRKLIEPHRRSGNWLYVRSQADRYVFDTQSFCWIDTLEFRTLLELGRKAEAAHEAQAAIGAYEAAAELYRGDYMQDEPFDDWCGPAREQFREDCLDLLNRLSALWGGLARWDRSAACSRRALLLDPLREEIHRALMYALWAAGRRDEAVRQYEACVHLLRERLDLAPLPETEQLFARIRTTPGPHYGH